MAERPVGIDFSHLRADGYRNINDFFPQSDRLHGVETLFGDWTAETLLLGQDICGTDRICARMLANPGKNPFYHQDGMRTNVRLLKFLGVSRLLLDRATPETCGLNYANAIWLIKKGGDSGFPIEDKSGAIGMAVSAPVLLETIRSMPRVRRILCLGRLPYQAVCRLDPALAGRVYATDRDNFLLGIQPACQSMQLRTDGNPVLIYPMAHPSRGSNHDHLTTYARISS